MNPRRLLIHFGALVALAGCSEEQGHGHAHDGSTHAPHHAFERTTEAVTSWGERSQLFVEFPALVVDEDSPFVAYLTALEGHAAIGTGVVTVELSGGGAPVESFTVDAPTTEGIFRPVIRPEHAGQRTVTLRIDSITFSEVHEVGGFEVFEDLAGASAPGGGYGAMGGGITYRIAQQWRVPFRVERAASRSMRPNVPAFARLEQSSEGSEAAGAKGAGEDAAGMKVASRLILNVEVPEAYVGRIRDVSGAWFHVDGPRHAVDVPREALISIGPRVDARTRTLPVRFRVDDTRRSLFAGMMAQAHLILDAPREPTAVPVSAVIDDAGTDVVYVQTGAESFERRVVRLGVRDGDHVEVTQGVAPDEWVVAEGGYGVKIASASTESMGHGHAH